MLITRIVIAIILCMNNEIHVFKIILINMTGITSSVIARPFSYSSFFFFFFIFFFFFFFF